MSANKIDINVHPENDLGKGSPSYWNAIERKMKAVWIKPTGTVVYNTEGRMIICLMARIATVPIN